MATMKDLRLKAETLLAGKITNKDALLEAVPVLVEFQELVKITSRTAKACGKVVGELSDACAEYALAHPTVFENGVRTEDGVQVGDVRIDETLYHLASGYGSPKRIDGENLSQSFIGELPKTWTKAKVELDTTAINRAHVPVEELEKHGLYRPAKNEWSEKAVY